MKVILQKDIPNLGDAGDIKEVAEGYARNFLLPKKLVIPASDSSQRVIEHQKKIIKLKKDKRKRPARRSPSP
jgi:large subunit ribosomal protein L9